jgi:hypothetical protein
MTLDSGARAPRARTRNLIVQELPDELMIYDADDKKVSCLNRTAAFVWRRCDGKRTVAQLARELGEELGAPVDEGVVWYALRRLDTERLLEESIEAPPAARRITRRQAVRALGIAALAAPLITSMIVPPPTHAQSGTPPCTPMGQICDPSGDPCCNGGTCTFNENEQFVCQ